MVILSGGLGNQLFQVAAAASCSQNCDLRINVSLIANPSLITEIVSQYNLRNEGKAGKLLLQTTNLTFFQRKAHNLALRNSSLPLTAKSSNFLKNLALVRLIKTFFPNFRNYVVPSEIGSGKFTPLELRNTLFIGYFQSSNWVKDVVPAFIQVLDELEAKRIGKWKTGVDLNSSLFVHVRRGDYESDNRIGVLPREYFIKAVEQAWHRDNFEQIGVYSNSNTFPLDCIPVSLQEYVRNMESDSHDALDLLLQLRLCKGGVISNSTLSWWAVETSRMRRQNITAPMPWFYKLKDPEGIINHEWNIIHIQRERYGAWRDD